MSIVVPLRDKVCVTLLEEDEKTAGGIFLPGNLDKAYHKGKVIMIGSGYFSSNGVIVPLEVKVDDSIVFRKNEAIEIKEDNNVYYVLSEAAIACVLKAQ